jgi:predicted DNA-binding antitoxin AbrB/MazE fold protein
MNKLIILLIVLIGLTYSVRSDTTGSTGTVQPTVSCGAFYNDSSSVPQTWDLANYNGDGQEDDIIRGTCLHIERAVFRTFHLLCIDDAGTGKWVIEINGEEWNSQAKSPCLEQYPASTINVVEAVQVPLTSAPADEAEVDEIVDAVYQSIADELNGAVNRRLLTVFWTIELLKPLIDVNLEVGETVIVITFKDVEQLKSAGVDASAGVTTEIIEVLENNTIDTRVLSDALITAVNEGQSELANFAEDGAIVDIKGLEECSDGSFALIGECKVDLVSEIIDKASEEAWLILLIIMAVIFCCVVGIAWRSHEDKHKKFHDVELANYMQNQNQYLAPVGVPLQGAPVDATPGIAPAFVEGGHTELPVGQEQVHITIG